MRLIGSIIFFFLSFNLSSQLLIETEYFYLKAVFDELPFYDTKGEKITNEKLFKFLFNIDYFTTIDWDGPHAERFHDLISNFTYPFYGPYTKYSHLKFRKSLKPEMTEIYVSLYNNETGEFIEDKTLFSINSKNLLGLNSIIIKPNNKVVLEQIYGLWEIINIEYRGDKKVLDSCLKKYSLTFSKGQIFKHGYYGHNKCELIDISKSSYKHWLSYTQGYWKVEGNDLLFVDSTFNNMIKWKYQFEKKTLKLSLRIDHQDYIITLRRK